MSKRLTKKIRIFNKRTKRYTENDRHRLQMEIERELNKMLAETEDKGSE